MSYARYHVHAWGDCEEKSTPECLRLTELLDQIEDDRAHREADRLRDLAAFAYAQFEIAPRKHRRDRLHERLILLTAVSHIDPYEMRDGQLVRKSDGKPVTRGQ